MLGVYYLTMEDDLAHIRAMDRNFCDIDEVELAYSLGMVEIHAKHQGQRADLV